MSTGEMLVCQKLFGGHLRHICVRALSFQIHDVLRPALEA